MGPKKIPEIQNGAAHGWAPFWISGVFGSTKKGETMNCSRHIHLFNTNTIENDITADNFFNKKEPVVQKGYQTK